MTKDKHPLESLLRRSLAFETLPHWLSLRVAIAGEGDEGQEHDHLLIIIDGKDPIHCASEQDVDDASALLNIACIYNIRPSHTWELLCVGI